MQKEGKQSKLILGLLFLTTSLFSCHQDAGFEGEIETNQGQLMLSLNSNTNFTDATRAVDESSYKNVGNYDVVVLDKDGNEKLSCKGSELASKMPLTLAIGSYTIRATYGEETAASRKKFFVLGEREGIIKSDQRESVEVECTPTSGRITVNFDESMSTYYADFNVVFSGTEALGTNTIAWLKNDTEPWYVKLKEGTNGETIDFTITSTTKDEFINVSNKEQVATKTGTFQLARNKAYKMNVKPSYSSSATGEVDFIITIDETTNDKEMNIDVPVTWL